VSARLDARNVRPFECQCAIRVKISLINLTVLFPCNCTLVEF
jgi:hypothetical protein